jgi:type I restriction enzyme S subunit
VSSLPNSVKLGEVAHFIRGVTFKPEDVVPVGTEGSIGCMRTKNVQSELDTSDLWHISPSLVKRTEQYLQSGDVIVSSANSLNLVGKCCWVPELPYPSTFGGFVSVLRRSSERLDRRYLYRWFSSPRVQRTVRSFSRQTTNIANLNLSRCLELELPLPSLEEQERIVGLLDEADGLRDKRKQVTASLNELKQALFVDIFGSPVEQSTKWDSATLGVLASEFRYGTSRKSGNEGYPALRIPNVVGGSLDIANLKLVPATPAELARLRLKHGDLLFVRSNGNPDYVGRCAVFSEDLVSSSGYAPDSFIYASYLIRARLFLDKVDPTYAREFLLGPAGRRSLRSSCKTSAGQYNINIEGLSGIAIPMPPLALQQEFARRVASISDLRERSTQQTSELDRLFSTLQQRAFDGEL